jgi:hypothetical protein
MTWKRCDGCNRAIATNAFTCDYCGHVCKEALSFLPSDDAGQPTTPWPADDVASVEGVEHGAAGSTSDGRPSTGLPPLELNDDFPFAHVFEGHAAPKVAPSARSEEPGESSGSDTLSSLFPVNDQPESGDVRAAEKPYVAPPSSVRRFASETKPAQDSMAPDFASQLDEIDDTLVDDYSHAGTAVRVSSEDGHSSLPLETELLEHAFSTIPGAAARSSQHTASPVPAAPGPSAPAGKLGTRAVAMMGGAMFAAAALIFTILSMRGSASPESAAAGAPAAGTSAPNATRTAARAKATALPAVLPKWSVVTDGRWVGADRKTVAFELQAINKIQIWTRDVTPVLVVRCQAGRIEPFVFTQSAARMEAQDEDHTVSVAFDDGPETTERWPDSVDHDALFARDAAGFTQQLAGAHTLRFGFTPHNAEPAVARFEVGGISDLLSSAPRQCGRKN